MHETLEHIKLSLEDHVMSRSEKKALKTAIADKNFDRHELNRLRSAIFNEARNHFKNFSHLQIIDWLEETNKLLLPREEVPAYSKAHFSPGNHCPAAILHNLSKAG